MDAASICSTCAPDSTSVKGRARDNPGSMVKSRVPRSVRRAERPPERERRLVSVSVIGLPPWLGQAWASLAAVTRMIAISGCKKRHETAGMRF